MRRNYDYLSGLIKSLHVIMIGTPLNYILLVMIKVMAIGIDYQPYLINTLSGLVEIQTRDIVVQVCDRNLFY